MDRRGGVGLRVDHAQVHPIEQQAGAVWFNLFLPHLVQHATRNRAHPIEGAQQTTLCTQCPALQTLATQEAQLERGVQLQVLNVQPRLGAAQEGAQPGRWCTGGGWRHHQHHLRPPRQGQTQHHRKIAEGKRRLVKQAPCSAGPTRHPQWTTVHGDARLFQLTGVSPAAVWRADLPSRVIGRGTDHPNLVATGGQAAGHFTRILADPGELRAVVHADQQ